MSTAIMLAYSRHGFVIAADGLRKNTDNPDDFTLTAKKIFDLSYGKNHIAYTLTGTAQYMPDGSETVVFDFYQEMAAVATALRRQHCRNLNDYATRMSRMINGRLRAATSKASIADLGGRPLDEASAVSVITIVCLVGFYNARPQITEIYFQHRNQRLLEPDVFQYRATPGMLLNFGSSEIYRLLFQTNDQRFARYRTYDERSDTMAEQIKICGGYVSACCDPEAFKIDPACAEIGGKLHIAVITPRDGFLWEMPPTMPQSL